MVSPGLDDSELLRRIGVIHCSPPAVLPRLPASRRPENAVA
jgi:hypothetical protein